MAGVPVISVAQLEPTSDATDPYNRPKLDHPDSVQVEGDTEDNQSYEVEKIFAERVRIFGKTKVVQCLIRWLGYVVCTFENAKARKKTTEEA